MLRTLFSPDRWQASYSALPTSWRSPASSPGNSSLAPEDYSPAVRHVQVPMSRSRKVLASLALIGVLIVSALFILRLDAPTSAHTTVRAASWASLSTAPSEPKEAPDGTPRAGLFAPLAGSAEPSVSLRSYLNSHFGPSSSSRYHVWVTMADAGWARTGSAAMHAFIEQLNAERRVRYGRRTGGAKETRLVVLCLDEECIDVVGRYKNAYGTDAGGGYAYGGYLHNRPEKVRSCSFCRVRLASSHRAMLRLLAADLVSSRLPFCDWRQLSHSSLALTNTGSSADRLLGRNLRVREESLFMGKPLACDPHPASSPQLSSKCCRTENSSLSTPTSTSASERLLSNALENHIGRRTV